MADLQIVSQLTALLAGKIFIKENKFCLGYHHSSKICTIIQLISAKIFCQKIIENVIFSKNAN